MPGQFKDHFSSVAKGYAESRPSYPPELFSWLASECNARDCAWDCGAGSGQASVGLAKHFQKVIATDASGAQIAEAVANSRIEYRIAPAEKSGLDNQSVDLITVAQALHWFDFNAFYTEVRRVLKPDGLIAVWCYGIMKIEGDEIDDIIQHFYHKEVGTYWPPERHHVETGYRNIPFPFQLTPIPNFSNSTQWNLEQLMGYFRSWSATQRFIKENGFDPITTLETRLLKYWTDPKKTRKVEWPLSILAAHL